MRLIDADRACFELERFYNGYAGELRKVASEALDIVCMMPEIEAEPVKHGRWIAKQTALGTKYTVCSNCVYGISIPIDGHLSKLDLSDVPRCPNCGAHMDLEDPDEA